MESFGYSFPADWFGKLKTILQSVVFGIILFLQWLKTLSDWQSIMQYLFPLQGILIALMLLATIGSGIQYVAQAVRLFRQNPDPSPKIEEKPRV